jgi:hypothetical protein
MFIISEKNKNTTVISCFNRQQKLIAVVSEVMESSVRIRVEVRFADAEHPASYVTYRCACAGKLVAVEGGSFDEEIVLEWIRKVKPYLSINFIDM